MIPNTEEHRKILNNLSRERKKASKFRGEDRWRLL
nr:MAG TPA_asm: hypothetical protein [Bacteriophage sp.]